MMTDSSLHMSSHNKGVQAMDYTIDGHTILHSGRVVFLYRYLAISSMIAFQNTLEKVEIGC